MSCGTVCPKFPSTAPKSDRIYPTVLFCVFLCVDAPHRSEATCYFEKWFASKAIKLSLKVYDARNTLMYLTLSHGYCSEYMLSLNIGLTGLSEITRMSEIRRFYPTNRFYPYLSRLLHWHCGDHTIASMAMKQSWQSDGLVQDCSNSIANALELLQSCTKPSKYGCPYFMGHNIGGWNLPSIDPFY